MNQGGFVMAGEIQQFTYPNSVELREIEQDKLPRSLELSPIFRYFPQVGVDSHLLEWTQRDTYGGMQQLRGLNGQPPRVATVGERKFIFTPGAYGEHMAIDEIEMTTRARSTAINTPIPIDDLVIRRQDQLLVRRQNRIEWLCWQLFLNGHFIAHDTRGVIMHRGAYAVQRFTAPVPWSLRDTATPLEDVSNAKLMFRGTGTDGGPRSRLLMNSTTAAHFTRNRNAADMGSRRGAIGPNILSVNGANEILVGEGSPTIEVYDGGYRDAFGNWVTYIPDGKVAYVGVLNNGETHGEFRFTRNINSIGAAPQPYVKVIDKQNQVPREIECHDGFNGGPVIFYPGGIIIMDVGV